MSPLRSAFASLCGAALFATVGCFAPVVATFESKLCVPVRIVDQEGNVLGEFAAGKEILIRQGTPDYTFQTFTPDGQWIPAIQSGMRVTCFGVTLWIDNRDHAAATVRAGSVVIEVPADSYGEYLFPMPRAAEHAPLLLDGVVVGELPSLEEESLDEQSGVSCLLDTSGQRAYVWKDVRYGDAHWMGELLAPKTYSGEVFYRLDYGVTHFLEEIPEEIDAFAGFESRSYLNEAEPGEVLFP